MGEACGKCGAEAKCTKGLDGETQKKDTNLKTWTQMRQNGLEFGS